MAEQTVRIETPDGATSTFIATPDDGGPSPVVIFYMDAPGIREALRDMARRVAAHGYYVVLPDLYYRFGEGIVFDSAKLAPGSEEMTRMFATMQQLSDEMVVSDTRAILEYVKSDELADDGPRGCVGFCMGGRHVLRVMSALPDEFAAGSGLHPSFLVTDGTDSPHLGCQNLSGELYLAYGEIDEVAPPSTIPALRQELDRHGVRVNFDVYAGADHGFMFPGHRYQEEAAEQSWERTLDLLRRNLQGATVGAR